MLRFLFAAFLASAPFAVAAADSDLPPELQGFGFDENILPIGAGKTPASSAPRRNVRQLSIIPSIIAALPKSTAEAAAYNISNPEQVFCYHVAKRPANFTGYTLDNFAIIDYCGELNASQTATTYEALFAQSPNIIMAVAACAIEPRVMLRFVRGVDHTDVLLSSPCPSFTIFYAGRYTSFNIKQGIIDDIISQFAGNAATFNSPAFLKQTVSNGTLSDEKLAEQYEKKRRETAPVMSWQKSAPASSSAAAPAKPRKGWGNIRLNM